MFTTILGQMSGGNIAEAQSQLIFNKVIGIRGVVDGVGCSTFVQGLAHAFSTQTRLSICVVDTNILYPSQYAYLGVSLAEQADNNDWLTQGQPVSRLVMDTKFKRVSLLGCFNRKLTDLFSSVDSPDLVSRTFDQLKSIFDIIIVDLGHEPTNLNYFSAVKCNRIYTILDDSAKCLSVLQRSLNNFATAGIPFVKFDQCILNKVTAVGRTGSSEAIKKCKLKLLGTVDFSQIIYQQGTSGKSLWGMMSRDTGVTDFNLVIEQLLNAIVTNEYLVTNDQQKGTDTTKVVESEPVELPVVDKKSKKLSKKEQKLKDKGTSAEPVAEQQELELFSGEETEVVLGESADCNTNNLVDDIVATATNK